MGSFGVSTPDASKAKPPRPQESELHGEHGLLAALHTYAQEARNQPRHCLGGCRQDY